MTILLFLLSPLAVQAADISVGTGCTLAQAITSANDNAAPSGSSCTAGDGDDTITIAADLTLSADLPAITSNITINGGSNSVSGNDARRIFNITGGTVTINNLTMTNGMVGLSVSGGAVAVTGGTVTINNSTITNTASGSGGALYVNGSSATVTVSSSVISNNTSSANGFYGAGILVNGGALTVTGSSITGNSRTGTGATGGGLSFDGNYTVSISNSYIGNNSAFTGAAMRIGSSNANSSLTVENSTIHNNQASSNSGGIRIQGSGGTFTFKHITLSNNTRSGSNPGAQFYSSNTSATIILANSIIDDAASGSDDCSVTASENVDFISLGNLIEDGSCAGTTSGDPLLGALTGTGAGRHLPLGNTSPAIGAGDDTYCADLSTDQIGTTRPATDCDVGAVENSLSALDVQNTATAAANMTASAEANQTGTAAAIATASADANNTATAQANQTATQAQLEANQTGTQQQLEADQTATQAKLDLDGTATEVKKTQQHNADETATQAKLDADLAATLRASGIRANKKKAKVEQIALPTPSPIYSTCERLAGSIRVSYESGSPQCNAAEFQGGADIVANEEIAAAGGYLDAVDVWGWLGAGVEVCFAGAGDLVFVDASTSPRTIYRIASYVNAQGWTCAFIDRPGTVVLMDPALISPMWPIAPWSSAPSGSAMASTNMEMMLTGCMVRTEYALFFRGSPGGEVIPPLVVEENALLTALERTADWFKVDYHGTQGWISAAHVTPQGNCG